MHSLWLSWREKEVAVMMALHSRLGTGSLLGRISERQDERLWVGVKPLEVMSTAIVLLKGRSFMPVNEDLILLMWRVLCFIKQGSSVWDGKAWNETSRTIEPVKEKSVLNGARKWHGKRMRPTEGGAQLVWKWPPKPADACWHGAQGWRTQMRISARKDAVGGGGELRQREGAQLVLAWRARTLWVEGASAMLEGGALTGSCHFCRGFSKKSQKKSNAFTEELNPSFDLLNPSIDLFPSIDLLNPSIDLFPSIDFLKNVF
jgi:hypothetical protein